MRKNKFLLLLALLMTAATGAWATDYTTLAVGDVIKVGDTFSPTAESEGAFNDNGVMSGETYTLIRADVDNDYNVTEKTDGAYYVFKYVSIMSSPYIHFEKAFAVTAISDGLEVTKIENMKGMLSYTLALHESAATQYSVTLKDGVKDADKWTISPNPAPEGSPVTIQYTGRLKVKGVKATSDAGAPAAGNIVELSTLEADYEAQNGDVLTGVTSSYKVTIAAGATVTLDGVTINRSSYCIKCLGDATIILKDGSTNTLTGTGDEYPALSIGDTGTTLTIQGSTGVLNVTSGVYCAGIGGGYSNTNQTCGNIRIEGGVITAQGGDSGAGIGTDAGPATCGDIIITGGTITAKGGSQAAGIGTGVSDNGGPAVCGDITIANTVTKVTATKGENAPHSIGKGDGSGCTCGTVTIGGTKYWENNAAVNGGDTYLAKSPLTVDPSAPAGSGSDIPNSDPYTPGGDPFSF